VDYRLMFDSEALEFFLTLRRDKRRMILEWLDRLKTAPFTKGQWQIKDSTGREVEVSLLGDLCVYHWSDHPVKTVLVTAIERSSDRTR
jgi:hypothetical protein